MLGVDKKSSEKVIQKAYKILAMTYHPDKNLEDDKEEATRKV